MIKKVTKLGYLTGPLSKSKDILTEKEAISTDLGMPIYDYDNKIEYYLFGDSFSIVPDANALRPGEGAIWHSNFVGRAINSNFEQGVEFQQVACPAIEGDHYWPTGDVDRYVKDTTKIPTGGVVVDGVLYVYYFSITEWNGWKIRYNGLIKSTDRGETFVSVPSVNFIDERLLYDTFGGQTKLCYVPTYSDKRFDYIVAPNFKQVNVCRDKDDSALLYIYGIGNGRATSARLARVRQENIENLNEYEFYVGCDSVGNAVWSKGKTGALKLIDNEYAIAIDGAVGELCVSYNDYVGKYMATYLCYLGELGQSYITVRFSDKPYGKFGEKYEITSGDKNSDINNIYGGFTAPFMFVDRGKSFYLTLSQWAPIYNVLMLKVELQ